MYKRCVHTFLFLSFSILFLHHSTFATWKSAAAHIADDANAKDVLVQVANQNSEVINLQYKVPDLTFEATNYQKMNGVATQFCRAGSAPTHSVPTEPEVPYIYSRVILPQGKTIASVRIIPANTVELAGTYQLSYGEIPHRLNQTEVTWAKPNSEIYNSDVVYPAMTHSVESIQYRWGVAIAYIHIFPVQYMPKSGKVTVIKEFTIEVKTKAAMQANNNVRVAVERFQSNYTMTEENPGILATYASKSAQRFPVRMCNPKDNYDYLAIAPQSFINSSADPSLDDLIKQRTSQGFKCKVEKLEDIYANASGSDNKNKIRNFIKEAYNNWKIKWVLLVGDPGRTVVLPCFMVGSEASDMPFQCLEQTTWDRDYEAEVYIGRISAEDPAEMANQIYKILSYENNSGSYWTTGLSLGEKLDDRTYGKAAMQELAGKFNDKWTFKDLHDQDGTWSKNQVKQIINSNEISLINHLGHSNATYNMKMRNNDERDFRNTNFIFIKTQGCIPGKYQVDCIAERFTTQNRYGMFAGVLNSNYGYYSPGRPLSGSSHQLHRAFWDACWKENMEYFGQFNEYSHRTCTRQRKDIVESNLFGCPAIKFRGRNIAPFIAILSPNGGEDVETGCKYMIEWGDNIDGKVKIELLKGGTVAATIASSTESDGSFEWDVPVSTATGNDYKVKVTSIDSSALFHESVENFRIIPEFIIKDFVYLETFDTCKKETEILPYKYAQLKDDDLNWDVWEGPTPSRVDDPPDVTGPTADHTPGGGGNYLYTEASASNSGNPNKKFIFETPKFNFKGLKDPQLTFWYHMLSVNNNEDHMGDLILDIIVDGTVKSEVVKISGNKGDTWHEQKVDLKPHVGERVTFRFRGITGDSWESDICLDDIKIEDLATSITNSLTAFAGSQMWYKDARLHYRVGGDKKASSIKIALFNVQGKQIKTLVDKQQTAGTYSVALSTARYTLASGIYFAKMKAGNMTKTIKIVMK